MKLNSRESSELLNSWEALTTEQRESFATRFVSSYLQAGFGALTKKEIDLLVVSGMLTTGLLDRRSNRWLSAALGIPESRIRNLLYEARLQTEVDSEVYLRRHLPDLLQRAKVEHSGTEKKQKTHVLFQVEDRYLQTALIDQIKSIGGIADYSFNAEVCKVEVDTLAQVLYRILPDETRKEIEKKIKGKAAPWKGIADAMKNGALDGVKEQSKDLIKSAFGKIKDETTNLVVTQGWKALLAPALWIEAIQHLAK